MTLADRWGRDVLAPGLHKARLLEQLDDMANERGVRALFDAAVLAFGQMFRHTPHSHRLSFTGDIGGDDVAVIHFDLKLSGRTKGLYYRLHEGPFVRFVGMGDVAALKETLPRSHERWAVHEFAGISGWHGFITTEDELQRLTTPLGISW